MTPPGGRGLAALALAVVLGVSGGAVTAFFAQDDATPQADGPDPLDVGVPLANLACNPDQTVVAPGVRQHCERPALRRPRVATRTA